MTISSGSFGATITSVTVDSGLVTAVVAYTLFPSSGPLPASGTATYTIKSSGCPTYV